MKNKNNVLYFFMLDGCFKMGVTMTLKKRLEVIATEFEEEINVSDSFYYEIAESSAFALEKSLKRKYEDYRVENDLYKTEVFDIEALSFIEQDIKEFHHLFDYEISKKRLIDKYVAVYDDDGKIKVQLTKNVKRIYDIFKGKEKYFEEIFQREIEE